jgi:phosphomannomutase
MDDIKFGTDGWRGVIAREFTFDRLLTVAPIAAQVLQETFGAITQNRRLMVGFDRRFMAEDFAQAMALGLRDAGFEVWLANQFAPTPALSWAAHQHNALGALVITASHNPGQYLGLKVKGNFGGSVAPELTQVIESRLGQPIELQAGGSLISFDPWPGYCGGISTLVDLSAIQAQIQAGKIRLWADVMNGAAAGGLERLLGAEVIELRGDRDPLFGGKAPEPLGAYLTDLCDAVRQGQQQHPESIALGLAFDGDSDRIAAVDSQGNFLSSQILLPVLMAHLRETRQLEGEVIKTVSTSNLVSKLSAVLGLPLYETPIGYKYIADRMLAASVLIGGEESGGIGYGHHIPERDALLSALYLLEAVVAQNRDWGAQYRQLQERTQYHAAYDRRDLHLATMAQRDRVLAQLTQAPPTTIADRAVTNIQTTDGYKFHLPGDSWLLVRFSGTEPVLRLYCEAADAGAVAEILNWANAWVDGLVA